MFVSDLHISGPDDPLYSKLLEWLRTRFRPGDTAVLGGDIFDLWVGDKACFAERYAAFHEALGELGRRGIPVVYLEGNHDFHLTQALARHPHIQVVPRSTELTVDGRRFFLGHGDLADSNDWGYRLLRAIFRSPPLRLFVRVAPDAWILALGRLFSGTSRGRGHRTASRLPTERLQALRKAFRSYASQKVAQGHDFVILGHCHDLDEMRFSIGERRGHYMNCGFPREHGSYISWESGSPDLQREGF